MDRTIGKSENRNNDGERLMISLLEIATNMNEADVDDDKIVKYKDKEGESQEMTAGAAKKQPDDHPAKVAYNKMSGDDGDDSEKDSGGKLGSGDFDRDSDDDAKPDTDDGDADDDAGDDDTDVSKIDPEMLADVGDIESGTDLDRFINDNGDKLSDQQEDDLYKVQEKLDDDSISSLAAKNEIKGILYHGSKTNATQISDDNYGMIDAGDIQKTIMDDPEISKILGDEDDVYFDGDELVSSKYDDETVTRVTGFMTIGDLKKKIKDFAKTKKESVRVINGKKYKAVKESKKHPLKQIYDRTFRSLK